MQKSKLRMLSQLYLKDMHDLKAEIIVVLAITILLDTWIYFASGYPRQIIILPVLMTIGLAAFIPLISSFKMLSREWNDNTVYLVMSLPVSGTMIMLSKLLAILSQFVIGTLVAGVTGGLMVWYSFPEIQPFVTENLYRFVDVYIIVIVGLLYLITSSFLSQVIGRLNRRHSGLITAGIFIAILYVVGKITDLVGLWSPGAQPGLQGIMPDIIWSYTGFYLLIALVLMVLTVYIYDHKVEL
ncbi:MAG: hypothetical protein ABFC94_17150 [Syntrophomonas sp.]